MLNVNDEFFNSIFISYSHKDETFAQEFREKLQNKLGDSIRVWIDADIPDGKRWRDQIVRRLNSCALVVVIISPDAIKSSWVLYEWHYSLLVLQSEPFLVYHRKCSKKSLGHFSDYQLKEPPKYEALDISKFVEHVAARFDGFHSLKQHYDVLVNPHEADLNVIKQAADALGNVPEGLSLAAANFLMAAIEFWLGYTNSNGYTLAGISVNLGRLGEQKSAPVVWQAFAKQVEETYNPAILPSIRSALKRLSSEDSL